MFPREESGRPKLITTVLATEEERRGFEYVVIARLPFRAQDNGLPDTGEFPRVCSVEDKVIEALRALGAWHLGHITFNGAMQAVFVGRRKAPSEIILKAGLLRKERVELDCRHDPDWTWYEAEMRPSAVELEFGRNQQLLGVLRDKGDWAKTPRLVDFTSYFPTEAARAAFVGAIEPEGYRVTEKGLWEVEGQFGCEMNLLTNIEPWVIAGLCAYVREQADLAGGEFDGWATPVTEGGASR